MVNKWIESATSGQIKDILSPGDLSEGTKAVLANAAYFKGSWASQFAPEDTEDEIFYTPTNQTFVPMMNKKGNFNHGRSIKWPVPINEIKSNLCSLSNQHRHQ